MCVWGGGGGGGGGDQGRCERRSEFFVKFQKNQIFFFEFSQKLHFSDPIDRRSEVFVKIQKKIFFFLGGGGGGGGGVRIDVIGEVKFL